MQGGYLLGPKLIELGTIASNRCRSRPSLVRISRRRPADTIHLGVRDGDDVLYIDKIPGTRGL